jgi:hydroxymethylglutaryl-CoA synthase
MLDEDINWKEHFDEKVSGSLIYPSRVGNIYTGSLWLALVSFLESCYQAAGNPLSHPNDINRKYEGAYLFSYGSGCGAVLIRGELSETWASMVKHISLNQTLENRFKLSIEQYDTLFDAELSATFDIPTNSNFKLEAIRNDERVYIKIR